GDTGPDKHTGVWTDSRSSPALQVRSLDAHLHPEKLKVIAQQLQHQHAQTQTQTLLRLQKLHEQQEKEQMPSSPVLKARPHHHITMVTMSPASVINTVSTSRQNLDTIVQAIQHIEGTQEKSSPTEEDQRRAVIITSSRTPPDPTAMLP
ncbi:hypothetical protein AAFF_G00331080, partial [Aldrovandia affinis]